MISGAWCFRSLLVIARTIPIILSGLSWYLVQDPGILYRDHLSGLCTSLCLQDQPHWPAWSFLTQVRLWELRTISVFGVGRSDAWSHGSLPSLITWEYRWLVSPVRGTIDQVSPQCAGGWSRGLAEETSRWWSQPSAVAVSPQFPVFQRAPPHSSR